DLGIVLAQYLGDGRRKRCLAVMDVSDRAYVYMRLAAVKFFFRHDSLALAVPVKFVELLAQGQVHCLQRRQIKLADLGLVADRERVIQLLRSTATFRQRPVSALQQLLAQHAIKIADWNSLALQHPEKPFHRFRGENPRYCRSKLLKLLEPIHRNAGLFKPSP